MIPEEVNPLLEAQWQRVLDDWNTASHHDAFISLCMEKSALGFAATKYRSQLSDPQRKEFAQKKITATVFLATQTLETAKSAPAPKIPRWILFVALSVTSSAIAWLVFALSR